MNEQLAQKLIEYINGTEAFLTSQAPEFVAQYLSWCYCEKVFWIVFLLLLFVIPAVMSLISFHKTTEDDWFKFWVKDEWTHRAAIFVISTCITIIMLLVNFAETPKNVLEVIKITKAPKVFLVERAAKLINK